MLHRVLDVLDMRDKKDLPELRRKTFQRSEDVAPPAAILRPENLVQDDEVKRAASPL